MGYNRKHLGQAVGMLREQRGLTQEALSSLAGISRSHLTLIENGHKVPRLDTMWNIADALDMPLSRLIGAAEELDGR